jgi:hypothetical protein
MTRSSFVERYEGVRANDPRVLLSLVAVAPNGVLGEGISSRSTVFGHREHGYTEAAAWEPERSAG